MMFACFCLFAWSLLLLSSNALNTKESKRKNETIISLCLYSANGANGTYIQELSGGDVIDLALVGPNITLVAVFTKTIKQIIRSKASPVVNFQLGNGKVFTDRKIPYVLREVYTKTKKISFEYIPSRYLASPGMKHVNVLTSYNRRGQRIPISNQTFQFEVIDFISSDNKMEEISSGTLNQLLLVKAGVPKAEAVIADIKDGATINMTMLSNLSSPITNRLSLFARFSGSESADEVTFEFINPTTTFKNGKRSDQVDRFDELEELQSSGLKTVTVRATKHHPDGSKLLLVSKTLRFTLVTNESSASVCSGAKSDCKGRVKWFRRYNGYSMYKMVVGSVRKSTSCQMKCIEKSKVETLSKQGWQCGRC
jgi:hypothetical protein